VRRGAFRADLYHRLSVFTLAVPPLRELEGDKLLLLEHFRHFYAEQAGGKAFSLDVAAERAWLAYPFPGNVRELRNIVIRLTAKHPGERLSPAALEPEFDLQAPESEPGRGEDELIEQALRRLERGQGVQLDQILGSIERSYIEAALRLARGNVSQAARLLGINRTTLYSRMQGGTGESQGPEAAGEPTGGAAGAAPGSRPKVQ
jgi:two-component system nitrogen regulation response regulator GlnG